MRGPAAGVAPAQAPALAEMVGTERNLTGRTVRAAVVVDALWLALQREAAVAFTVARAAVRLTLTAALSSPAQVLRGSLL